MGIKSHIRNAWNFLVRAFNFLLRRFHYTIVPNQLVYEWQKLPRQKPGYKPSKLPEGAAEYLVSNNPRLIELKNRYANFDKAVTVPFIWTNNHVSDKDMLYFRGDNAYVHQVRGRNLSIIAYALSTYYLKSIDTFGLLEKLQEDNYFGIHTFNINNKLVSRDLLDSIFEIYFIEKHLKISSRTDVSMLDIGAGYGRLAHRLTTAFPNIVEYLCTDAFAVSTFISEYYLRFRNTERNTTVVPLDEINEALSTRHVNLAINIHSFSECKIPAIAWWLTLLVKHQVQYLMIVPNTGQILYTNDGIEFQSIIEDHGYRLIAKEPKYNDPIILQNAISPNYYYLFELSMANS